MGEAPEKKYFDKDGFAYSTPDPDFTEYTRTDLIPAMLAQARREALEEAAHVVEGLWAFRTCREVADAILAIIDKDQTK